ncbi:CGNR zinc finger domain-containing protein [Pseudonocardia yuanmonensis]|uniref:CGNR zinc finger domain-containing protein n=2 Tax=Pseudonocardia yuanmonensis TaxID=1095914 RepID=A0ABP8X607_9PSEU
MLQTACERYGAPPEPGGLAVVQDLLNTAARGRPRHADLLEHPSSTSDWLRTAADLWISPPIRPCGRGRAGRGALARDRDHLKAVAGGTEPPPGPSPLHGELALELGPAGELTIAPGGEGVNRLAGAVLHEIHRARPDSRTPGGGDGACSGAFFDRSRNNSAVWHDGRPCGNPINLGACGLVVEPATTLRPPPRGPGSRRAGRPQTRACPVEALVPPSPGRITPVT